MEKYSKQNCRVSGKRQVCILNGLLMPLPPLFETWYQ